METQNIEKVVENIVNTLIYNYWDSKFDDVEEVRQWLRTTLTQLVKEVEAKGHQAGIDEAETEILQEIMDDLTLLHKRKEIDDNAFCTIRDLLHSKALQDNK